MPIFVEWLRKPLQAELFGTHTAGEEFFVSLQQLLGRGDSADLADLIEIHYLCMLLGFSGRYSAGNRGELAQIMNITGEKIRRIRGRFGALSPAWQPPKRARGQPGAIRGSSAGASSRRPVLWSRCSCLRATCSD